MAALSKYEDAIKKYKKALQIYSNSELNSSMYAYVYSNIGDSYIEMGNSKKAKYYHKQALDILEKTYPDRRDFDLGKAHQGMASAYVLEKNASLAMSHLNQTFEIYPQVLHENSHHFITAFDTLCDILSLQGDYENALNAANKALNLFMENNYTETDEEVIQYKGKIREIENIIKYAERD